MIYLLYWAPKGSEHFMVQCASTDKAEIHKFYKECNLMWGDDGNWYLEEFSNLEGRKCFSDYYLLEYFKDVADENP